MNTVYATIGKPTELYELYSAINYFGFDKVIITITNKSRINKKIIFDFFELNSFDLKVIFKDYNFSKGTYNDFYSFLQTFNSDINYYALSLGYNRILYKVAVLLKNENYTLIHISDGVAHAFSLIGYVLGFRFKLKFRDIVKCFIVYFEYKKSMADYSFFSLYPNFNCFSKQTLPITYEKKISEKMDFIKKSKTLIVPGWGMTVQDLANYFNVSNNYCATSKDKEIFVDGSCQKLTNYITGEDVIDSSSIETVVGTPSTVLIYAKTKHPNLNVHCVLTGELNKTYGLFYEYFYVKLGKKVGVKFHNLNS